MTVPALDNLNLDCMDLSDLQATAAALNSLARYAERKAQAISYRASGRVDTALRLESECDQIYARLPADWCW